MIFELGGTRDKESPGRVLEEEESSGVLREFKLGESQGQGVTWSPGEKKRKSKKKNGRVRRLKAGG